MKCCVMEVFKSINNILLDMYVHINPHLKMINVYELFMVLFIKYE